MNAGAVELHYEQADLAERISSGLTVAGLDGERVSPEDLAPVDEFHIRGRQATVELAELAQLTAGERVLDAGCGLGGPARHLAADFGVEVVGVDLTPEYCRVATLLSEKTGLSDRVTFRCANVLDLPFDDGAFDVVWTQHAAMNIADKPGLYSELRRVARPGGRLALYDVIAGPGGAVHFPVPWARNQEISFLSSPEELRELLEGSGFSILQWRDVTEPALDWFRELAAAAQLESTPTLGIHLLLGTDAPDMFANQIRNLEEERIKLVQTVAEAV